MNKKFLSFLLALVIGTASFAQQATYTGPVSGSVPSGQTVTTGTFPTMPLIITDGEKTVRNKIDIPIGEPGLIDGINTMPSAEEIYHEWQADSPNSPDAGDLVLLNDFEGATHQSSIPPDPHIAVGPNHVIIVVNSSFHIYDKSGNLLKIIGGNTWFASTYGGASTFDPKVVYDQYEGRWIMVWLHQNDSPQQGQILISVSDDDNPLGSWNNWALPSNKNGSTTVANWMDYQAVGFDQEAVYIVGNQFQFGGSFQYPKIRIISKADLYQATPGVVNYNDIYNIRYPAGVTPTGAVMDIRSVVHYGDTDSSAYFLHGERGGGNFVILYKLTNPLTNPILYNYVVSTSNYMTPPDANQLGGGTPRISANGAHFQDEPKFRDGYLWAVSNTRNPTAASYSAVRYVKIDVATALVSEEFIQGQGANWFLFPAIAVDSAQNVGVTFSRSSNTTYCGAFYTGKVAGGPLQFLPIQQLKPGYGNYVVTYGGTRNRWGDYMGIWLDPVNQASMYLHTEYVKSTNLWGTWVGEIRLMPYQGVYAYTVDDTVDAGSVELTFVGDTTSYMIANFGENNLVINSMDFSDNQFELLNDFTYPLTVEPFDTIFVDVRFTPANAGTFIDQLEIGCNDPNYNGVPVIGVGYLMMPSDGHIMYASTGEANSGMTQTVNLADGSVTELGYSNYLDIVSIASHPKTNILYGIRNASTPQMFRMSAEAGDAYYYGDLPVNNVKGCSFDSSGTLYVLLNGGIICTVDLETMDTTRVVTAESNLNAIAFNPLTNELWAAILKTSGISGRDKILKINLETGDTTLIGSAGLGASINDLEFDELGNLYGIRGDAASNNSFFTVDTSTGTAVVLNSAAPKSMTGLAYSLIVTVGNDDTDNNVIPAAFKLEQNFPNPFNPSTTINYSLPVNSSLRLTVYNLLGEAVNVLFEGTQSAGNYSMQWNAVDSFGRKLSSGVYFLELRANEGTADSFIDLKKMVLVK